MDDRRVFSLLMLNNDPELLKSYKFPREITSLTIILLSANAQKFQQEIFSFKTIADIQIILIKQLQY